MEQRETLDDWLNALAAIGIEMEPVGAHNYNGPCPLCGGTDRFHLSPTETRVRVGCRQCIDYKPKRVSHERFGMLLRRLFPTHPHRKQLTPIPNVPSPSTSGSRQQDLEKVTRLWRATVPADGTLGADYLILRRWCWPPSGLGYAFPADVRWLPQGAVSWPRLPAGASGALVFAFRLQSGKLQAVHLEAIDANGERVSWESPKGQSYPRKTLGGLADAYFRLSARKPEVMDAQLEGGGQVTVVEGVEDALAEYWASPHTDIIAGASTIARIEPHQVKDYQVIRLLHDPDEAGREAAFAARTKLLEEGVEASQVRAFCYPDGDPAEHWKRMLMDGCHDTPGSDEGLHDPPCERVLLGTVWRHHTPRSSPRRGGYGNYDPDGIFCR